MEETWNEIEDLQTKHDNYKLHKNIKDISGTLKTKVTNWILDKNNKSINDLDKIKREWTKNIWDSF